MEKPNVTVIYQDAKQEPIGCLRILLEAFVLVVFCLVFVGISMLI